MNLSQADRYRRLIGKIGLVVGLILVTAMIDVVITRHLTHFNILHVVPGQEVPIDGPMPEKSAIQDLSYACDSPQVKIIFDEAFAGFWFGGKMWRGKLAVGPDATPGNYTLRVTPQSPEAEYPPVIYSVTIYPDVPAWRRSSASYYLRYLGVSHWWVMVVAIPVLALTGLSIFYLSGRIDNFMAQGGLAEVYRVRRAENGLEISFGLGTDHGLGPGSRLTLKDDRGKPLGQIQVLEAYPDHSLALVDNSLAVKAGFTVSKLS